MTHSLEPLDSHNLQLKQVEELPLKKSMKCGSYLLEQCGRLPDHSLVFKQIRELSPFRL